jgi:hypothetical protein
MFYAFFLFWPANVIPIFILISLLQLFIPLNLFVRSCCVNLTHKKIHIIAAIVIVVGIGINLIDLKDSSKQILKYSMMFMICSLCDVISHAIKESLVRSQPLN